MYGESQGQLQDFVNILKKRRWQIVLPAVFLFALGCALAVIIPRKYVVTAEFQLLQTRVEQDARLKNPGETSLSKEIVNAELALKSRFLLEDVIEELGWEDFAVLRDAQRIEYLQKVRQNLTVAVMRKEKQNAATYVEIGFKHIDPERAEAFLDLVIERWVDDISARDVAQLAMERDTLQNVRDASQKLYHEALDWKERVEKEMGLLSWTSTTETGSMRGEDPIVLQLTELNSKILLAEADVAAKVAGIEEVEKQLLNIDANVLVSQPQAGASAGSEVIRIETEIARLKTQQDGLLPAHSRHKLAQTEIDALEKQLKLIKNIDRTPPVTQEYLPNPRRQEFRDRVAELNTELRQVEARLTQLEGQRRALQDTMTRRLELRRELEAATLEVQLRKDHFVEAETELKKKLGALAALNVANREPYRMDSPPTAPEEPSEPNPYLIVGVALIGGLIMGLTGAVLAEFTKNSFRTVGDVTNIMTIPVLGVINTIVTSAQRRRARLRGLVIGGSSAVMLGVLGWFTWAFWQRPELLPSEVVYQIQEFQKNFH